MLKVKYEGKDGAAAEWIFDGMALIDGRRMTATAMTQTIVDPKRCLTCGEEKNKSVEVKHQEVQTDMHAMRSTGVQTAASVMTSTGVQSQPSRQVSLHHQIPNALEILGPYIDTPAITSLVQKALGKLEIQLRKSRSILDREPKA